jgi:leukotriene-A4 hydrolase
MSSSSLTRNAYSRRDQSSQSNPSEVMSILMDLKWTLDFDRCVIVGSVTHTMKVVKEGATHAKFDSSGCHISKARINVLAVPIDDSQVSKDLGTCVSVEIPPQLRGSGSEFLVTFEYETDKGASAVQWLAPAATSSGKFPYVFTQCQAIHARSLMPCQDSPGVKTAYTASVTAPVSGESWVATSPFTDISLLLPATLCVMISDFLIS